VSDLHKLVISAPDGVGYKAVVTLDGQPLACRSVTLRVHAEEVVSAVIELDFVSVEFDGVADVAAKTEQAG
jgi:hypothetical protein